MADKEATVFIVDVGKSMGKQSHGREENNLDWVMRYVWDRIATTVSTGRKTLCNAVVALRSDETNHDLATADEYNHISVLKPLGQTLMSDIRNLRDQIRPSNTEKGDALSAIVVAIQMMEAFTKKNRYIRTIILVTDGTGPLVMDEDVLEITKKVREDGIDLVVLGVDFDDAEYGFKEENKDSTKAANEKNLKKIVDECGGSFGTMQQAISELEEPRVKTVKPVPSYKGKLTLGDAGKYETAMILDVERYPRTMVARPPTASSFVIQSDLAPDDPITQSSATLANGNEMQDAEGGELSAVRNTRTYQVTDENAPGGKLDVDRDSLAKGYEYGRTAVPISETDEIITKLETKASFEILGFVPAKDFEHFMGLSRTNIIVPQRHNDKATMGLSSFVHALFELETYAIARLVPKDNKEPILLVLAPSIEPEIECLVDLEIPFAEDVRSYKFPPLDKIVTVSGKVLKEHRNLPNDDLKSTMEEFVDQMDLSTFDTDEDGNPTEYMRLTDSYSPIYHRIQQAVRYRAVHPDKPVPPAYDAITRFMKPPEELLKKCASSLEKVNANAEVKKVPPKSLSKKRFRGNREQVQPRSGLDVAALLSNRASKSSKISVDNAIPEFKQMLERADDVEIIGTAISQFAAIIEGWIRQSFGDSNYDRALEAIGVMRTESIEMEEPELFNNFIKSLKSKLLTDELGGDRREMWWKIRGGRYGLIEKRMSPQSHVDEAEAKEFLFTRY